MRAGRWLLVAIVVVLATCAWISAMDTTGDTSATWLLWAATMAAATTLLIGLLRRQPR